MADLKAMTSKGKDGKEVRYSIEEIENGFVITISKEWEDSKGNYKYESKKYYSEENPFAKQADNMFDIMKSAIDEKD